MAFTHNIKTSYDKPPIPTRDHDWSAWFDWASPDDDHFISGNGETEQAAVANLIAKAAKANEPRYHGEIVDMAFEFWSAPKWQPIETAPKDGTELLLWNDTGLSIGEWQGLEEDQLDQPGHNPGWYGVGLSADPMMWGRTDEFGFKGTCFLYEAQGQPTRWMPLPNAPKKGGADA